jgi:hypothetical protein
MFGSYSERRTSLAASKSWRSSKVIVTPTICVIVLDHGDLGGIPGVVEFEVGVTSDAQAGNPAPFCNCGVVEFRELLAESIRRLIAARGRRIGAEGFGWRLNSAPMSSSAPISKRDLETWQNSELSSPYIP